MKRRNNKKYTNIDIMRRSGAMILALTLLLAAIPMYGISDTRADSASISDESEAEDIDLQSEETGTDTVIHPVVIGSDSEEDADTADDAADSDSNDDYEEGSDTEYGIEEEASEDTDSEYGIEEEASEETDSEYGVEEGVEEETDSEDQIDGEDDEENDSEEAYDEENGLDEDPENAAALEIETSKSNLNEEPINFTAVLEREDGADITVGVMADEGTFPMDTEMVISEVDEDTISSIRDRAAEDLRQMTEIEETEDENTETEIEEAEAENTEIEIEEAEDGNTETEIEEAEDEDTETEIEEAEDTKAEIEETEVQNDEAEINADEEENIEAASTQICVAGIEAIDITFLAGEEEVEPQKPVRVVIVPDSENQKADDSGMISAAEELSSAMVYHLENSGEMMQVEQLQAEPQDVDALAGTVNSVETAEDVEAAGGVVFEAHGFSVYAIVYTVVIENSKKVTESNTDRNSNIDAKSQISADVLTAAGETYRITVAYDDDAQIPEGTKLAAREIEPGTDEYTQYLGRTWSEINREYFEVEEMRENYEESMGELPEVHFSNIIAARFFDITLIHNNKEIEPEAPVQVEISYEGGNESIVEENLNSSDAAEDGLNNTEKAAGGLISYSNDEAAAMTTPGVVHYVSDGEIEIISDVDTTVVDDVVTNFRYEQSSFSVVGTYVSRETTDLMTAAAAPAGNASGNSSADFDGTSREEAELSDDILEDIINQAGNSSGLFRRDGNEQPDSADTTDLEKPQGSKTLTPNIGADGVEDGTYTLTLSVKGHSSVSAEEVVKKSNILFVMDRSSSMITKTVNNESTRWYYGTKNTSSWRGDIDESHGYHFIGIVNGREVDLNLNYGWPNSWSNPAITYQSGTDWWGNPQYSDYPDDAPIYVVSKKTRMTAEQEALNNLFTQLLDKNAAAGTNSDAVEISVISFGDMRFDKKSWKNETEAGWTGGRDTTSLTNVISSNRYTSGTNWEEALEYAYEVISAKKNADGDDEDYYVVFLTDGEPTAVRGDSGAEHTTDPVTGAITKGKGNIYAYGEAKDEAKKLVDNGFKFYNIFTYRTSEDEKYSIYLTNYAYGNGDKNGNKTTDAVKNYFNDAQTPEDVINALQNIFYTIEDSIGHANVSITDTLTTDAMTTTVVQGKTNGYVYEVKNSAGTVLYTVTATGDLNDPEVVFHVPDSSSKDYLAAASTVGGKTVYTARTAEGRVYKMALADKNDSTGELVWDLSSVGVLMNDCTYSVSFIVWPDQDAYDYVAGLNNGLAGYKWDTNAATYEDLTATKGYEKGGVQNFPSIVRYPNGIYAVLTNTDQKLHYSVVETRTDGTDTNTTVTGPFYSELPLPEPMPLKASASRIEKVWNVERDPGILAQLLYDMEGNSEKFSITFDILQGSEKTKYTDVTLGWDEEEGRYQWEENSEKHVTYNGHDCVVGTRWAADFSIATGLMLSETRMDALGLDKTAYPSGSFEGVTYYILEGGHDYTIEEPVLTFEFDFTAPVYHPMLVDGVLQSVNFTMDGDSVAITAMTSEEEGLPSLKIENTLRGYINLNKVVVGEDGHTVVSDDNTEFTYVVNLSNSTEPGPFTEEGDHIPWYGISGLYYHDEAGNYYQAVPNGAGKVILTDEAGNVYDASCAGIFSETVGPQNVTFTDADGNKQTIKIYGNQMDAQDTNHVSATIKITQAQTLNIANVPVGTVYEITEQDINGYELVKIEREVKLSEDAANAESSDTLTGSASISGTIVANRDNHVVYYNRSLVTDITVRKVDEYGNGLEGAVFVLKKAHEENGTDGNEDSSTVDESGMTWIPAAEAGSVKGLGAVKKIVNGIEKTFNSAFETTGEVQTISGLTDGTYRLYEVYVPGGYFKSFGYIQFTIENRAVKDVTTDSEDAGVVSFTAASESAPALLTITNKRSYTLPSTGGPGTMLFTFFGCLILAIAGLGFMLLMTKRMRYAKA